MLSVFQIFKMILGVIVFVFVMTFFLRISDLYSGVGEKRIEFEIADAFDRVVKQTYTSGNPTTFNGFTEYEFLLYNTPKLLFGSSQKTLTIPVFMIADKAEMTLERRCEDYGWFRFCWVFAYSEGAQILFTPLDNRPADRDMIRTIIDMLPDSYDYGFCNGTDVRVNTKELFIVYLTTSLEGDTFQDCEFSLKDNVRLVTLGETDNLADFQLHPGGEISIQGNVVRSYVFGEIQERTFTDNDIVMIVTGGVPALDYKKEAFEKDLKTISRIMWERTKLVRDKTLEYNQQPCEQCATPYPKECGWKSYGTPPQTTPSTLYNAFISTLSSVHNAVDSGAYMNILEESVQEYEDLKDKGCEM